MYFAFELLNTSPPPSLISDENKIWGGRFHILKNRKGGFQGFKPKTENHP